MKCKHEGFNIIIGSNGRRFLKPTRTVVWCDTCGSFQIQNYVWKGRFIPKLVSSPWVCPAVVNK